jgi:hypothetical protein
VSRYLEIRKSCRLGARCIRVAICTDGSRVPVRHGITPWASRKGSIFIETSSHELSHSLKSYMSIFEAGYQQHRIQFIYLANLDQHSATITVPSVSPHASTSARTPIRRSRHEDPTFFQAQKISLDNQVLATKASQITHPGGAVPRKSAGWHRDTKMKLRNCVQR